MIECSALQDVLKKYHENKMAHAFLIETNDANKCFTDLQNLIKNICCPFDYSANCKNECNICNLIDHSNLPSLIVIDPDGQNIKKNQILAMMDSFSTKPIFTKFNIYVIREADRLNASSANTILKFLEEPEDNILGFLITNNRENVISTVRSRCQVISCVYEFDASTDLDEEYLDNVKLYLNAIYKNDEDLLYNKTHMTKLYSDRVSWEKFFNTMIYYLKDCCDSKRIDKIDMVKNISFSNLIKIILEIEVVIKYIKSNVNIDLVLDKFVIEMRNFYE